MQRYVLGFVIDGVSKDEVVLIRKTKPAWQRGRLNGVGGKIEPDEKTIDAMIREFTEEAGVVVENWEQFATITDESTFHVSIFRSWDMDGKIINSVATQTEENIEVYDISKLPIDVIDNLRWLLPLAVSNDSGMPLYIVERKT